MSARLAVAAVALAALALAGLGAAAAPGPAAKPSQNLGTKCGVFPRPGSEVAADAASLPDQRAWNQDVSRTPVHPQSQAIINRINAAGADDLHPDFGSAREYGIPYRVVGKRAKKVRVRFTAYGDESDRGAYRVPLNSPVEGGARGDGDRHVIVYDKARCKLYELYRAFPKRKPKRWEADSGVIWNLRSAGLRPPGWTSADAAGLPVFPGLVRYAEVKKGSIDHALRVTFETTRDAWINPASHCAGSTDAVAAPPMGMRLRMRADYDISSLTGHARTIAEAMKRYGLIVADNGSNWFFQGATDRRWSDENLNQLKDVPGGAFEVVRSQAEPHVC